MISPDRYFDASLAKELPSLSDRECGEPDWRSPDDFRVVSKLCPNYAELFFGPAAVVFYETEGMLEAPVSINKICNDKSSRFCYSNIIRDHFCPFLFSHQHSIFF